LTGIASFDESPTEAAPLMLLYTIISYSVFRGKVASTPEHY
jgi:cytochrome bd-type quinol oxidase subunit 2